jgi:hypothetical protein
MAVAAVVVTEVVTAVAVATVAAETVTKHSLLLIADLRKSVDIDIKKAFRIRSEGFFIFGN